MGDEHPRAAGEEAQNALIEDVRPHVGVDGTQHIIEEHDVCVSIARTRQVDTLLLPAAQIDPALANLGSIAVREEGDVRTQGARVEDGLIPRGLEFRAKEDVLPQRRVRKPRALRAVRDLTSNGRESTEPWHVPQHGCEEGGLAAPSRAADDGKLARAHSERYVAERDARSRSRAHRLNAVSG